MKGKASYINLCVVLVLCCFPGKSESLNDFASIADQTGCPGDTGVLVAVSLNNETPVRTFRFGVEFDKNVVVATRVELGQRTGGFELHGYVGTENWLCFEVVAPAGQHLPTGGGPVAAIFFNVDSSAQAGSHTTISFLPDSCAVLDTSGVPLPSLLLVAGVFTICSVSIPEPWTPETGGLGGWIKSRPNPFRDVTTIEYAIPDLGWETKPYLEIFDQMGRCIAVVTEYTMKGRSCVFQWNGSDKQGRKVSSGVYFHRLGGIMGSGRVVRSSGERLILLR